MVVHEDVARGLDALRSALARFSNGDDLLILATAGPSRPGAYDAARSPARWLLSEAATPDPAGPGRYDDSAEAMSSEESEDDRTRLIALVELARTGDSDAFGLLYDHYQPSVYRFLFYRTRSSQLAEDLASETFFRARTSAPGS